MSTQYAICHMERGSGNDAGMSCHIERKTADGKTYVPQNADKNRTHLNRELITFPMGVANRTEAIKYRVDHAGLHRKVAKNQTKAIRILLSGSPDRMAEIEREGKLEDWINANICWLKETFGADNLVSLVLHNDEKTPHLHATITPIVDGERKRRKREGDKKNRTQNGPRLSADDVMGRMKLKEYQNSYGNAMKPFGLERGVVGSTAKHVANSTYYKDQMVQYEDNIAKLQKEYEKAQESKSTLLAFFGKGDLAKAKKELLDKDQQIANLTEQLEQAKQEKEALVKQHKADIAKLYSAYKTDIANAIHEIESLKSANQDKDKQIEKQAEKIEELDRKANPERYRLSSGAELTHYFVPNRMQSTLHIWTKVGDEEFDTAFNSVPYELMEKYSKGDITVHEFANAVFEPWEQVNEVQANLLGTAFIIACGGQAQTHIGTGSGGSQSELPWNDRRRDKNGQRR